MSLVMMVQSCSSLSNSVVYRKSFVPSLVEPGHLQSPQFPVHTSSDRTDQSCSVHSLFPFVSLENASESFQNMIPVCVFALKSTEKVRREFLLTLAFTIKSFN